MSVMTAAFNVASDYPGGTSQLARHIDKNPTTLLHEVKGTGGAKLGLKDAVKMTVKSDDLRILLAFALECGQMCIPLPDHVALGDECMTAMSGMSREFAELCQEVCGSLGDDGEINDNEMARIERAGGELSAALHSMLNAARARNHLLHLKQAGSN